MITHVITEIGRLPSEDFLLTGADIIPLVVLPDFACIGPETAECQCARAGKGQFTVDQQLAFNIDAAAFNRQVIKPDIVQPGLGNFHFPGNL